LRVAPRKHTTAKFLATLAECAVNPPNLLVGIFALGVLPLLQLSKPISHAFNRLQRTLSNCGAPLAVLGNVSRSQ
jgi:hypothetical protein